MRTLETPWSDRLLVVSGEAPRDWFGYDELAEARSFRLEKRRSEWLLGRYAAKRLALQLGLGDDPRTLSVARPELLAGGAPTGWFVSVSHSEGWAGAALSRSPIGVDVQAVRLLPAEAAHLFLTDDEAMRAGQCPVPDALLHFWSAKEAAFKRLFPQFNTLRQVPLCVVEVIGSGLRFDRAVTMRVADLIVAVSETQG